MAGRSKVKGSTESVSNSLRLSLGCWIKILPCNSAGGPVQSWGRCVKRSVCLHFLPQGSQWDQF